MSKYVNLAMTVVFFLGMASAAFAVSWVRTGELDGATYVNDLMEATSGAIYAGTSPAGDA